MAPAGLKDVRAGVITELVENGVTVNHPRFPAPGGLFGQCANQDSAHLATLGTILTAHSPPEEAAFYVERHRKGESR